MTKRKTHPRIGSDFEDFLRDEGRLEEATAVAIKRLLDDSDPSVTLATISRAALAAGRD